MALMLKHNDVKHLWREALLQALRPEMFKKLSENKFSCHQGKMKKFREKITTFVIFTQSKIVVRSFSEMVLELSKTIFMIIINKDLTYVVCPSSLKLEKINHKKWVNKNAYKLKIIKEQNIQVLINY